MQCGRLSWPRRDGDERGRRDVTTKTVAIAAATCVGIAAAIVLLMITSLLDGVVDPNKGIGRLAVIAVAGFIVVLSGGLAVATYRYVKERVARRQPRRSN
jgi:hypothetical protein